MKKVKLLALFLLLALTLNFTGCNTGEFKGTAYKVLPGRTDGTAGKSWTYVLFGDWPQTIKADSVTVDESKVVNVEAFTYYKGSDGAWYAKLSSKYYKVEPIKWRVLTDNYSGKKLLLAESILAAHRYAESSNNYKNSEIREWLNGTFLGAAFTSSAQNQIATTNVDNSADSTTDNENNLDKATSYVCENTSDKIFLLSEQEVTKEDYGFAAYNVYKGDSNGTTESTRIRMTTDWSKAGGAYQNSTAGYGGWWWLRSSAIYSDCADAVKYNGNASDFNNAYNPTGGVVPALSLN